MRHSRRVVPHEEPAPKPKAEPKAPLLRRLAEIERSIKEVSAPPHLDGFKTLPLHKAARRGDMREVARLLPDHRAHMALRDETGWLPMHHAAVAGRRCSFRVPLKGAKMLDWSVSDAVLQDVCGLIEAATTAEDESESGDEPAPTGGGGGAASAASAADVAVQLTFSERVEQLLNEYVPDGAPAHRLPPSLPTSGGPPGHRAPPSAPHRAAPAPPPPRPTGPTPQRAEAAAARQLHDESPVGIWVEVRWVAAGGGGVGASAKASAPASAPPPPPASAAHLQPMECASLEVTLLELHDSEHASAGKQAQSASGRVMADVPLMGAIRAVASGLSVYAPPRAAGSASASYAATPRSVASSAQQRDDFPPLLLRGAMGSIVALPTLRLKRISASGPLLSGAGGSWKDFHLVASSSIAQRDAEGSLGVPREVVGRSVGKPRPSALQWGDGEDLTLALPSVIALPLTLSLQLVATDGVRNRVVMGLGEVTLRSLQGTLAVVLTPPPIDEEDLRSRATNPPPSVTIACAFELHAPYGPPHPDLLSERPPRLGEHGVLHSACQVGDWTRQDPYPKLAAKPAAPAPAADAPAAGAAASGAAASSAAADAEADAAAAAQQRSRPLGCYGLATLYDGPACVRQLLAAGSDANSKDLVLATALHKATAHGDLRTLKLLMGGGADVDAANVYGDTCLHRGVENARMGSTKLLIANGADLDKPNKSGNTPLHVAAFQGLEAFVTTLLSAGAICIQYNLAGAAPLHTAVAQGHRGTISRLTEFHKSRRLPWRELTTEKSGDTPLHMAVRQMRVADLVWMVDKGGYGPALCLKNAEGRTPTTLLLAAQKQMKKMSSHRKKAMRNLKKGLAPPPPFRPQGGKPSPTDEPELKYKVDWFEPWSLRGEKPPPPPRAPTPPPPPPIPKGKGKKGKKAPKPKKEKKAPPPPPFTIGLDDCVSRLGAGGNAFIEENMKALQKRTDEEAKIAEKARAEKAKKMEAKGAKKGKGAQDSKKAPGASKPKLA